MGMLDGKRLLITGVLTEASLAFATASLAQAEGAEVVLTGAGRALSITQRTAKKLAGPPPVYELDVSVTEHADALRATLAEEYGRIDGALHSIGFAPPSCIANPFMEAPWEDVATAIHVSAYSLKTLADVVIPCMPDGGSIVGLDFDSTLAFPEYNWMGVAKSALESTSRYLARTLGPQKIRVNLVSAGPIKTMASKAIADFSDWEETWAQRAPLGWSLRDNSGVAKACVALLSDWFPQTTGELLHVDGGYHAMGA